MNPSRSSLMKHFRRVLLAIVLTVLSAILLFSAVFVAMIVTPTGGKLLVRLFKKEFAEVGLLHIGSYQGTLQNGFALKNLIIKGLNYMPNALVLIQEIDVRVNLWDMDHSNLSIFNARIFIPNSDPVVFTGQILAGQVKGELYGKSIDIHEASRFWTTPDISKNLKGFVTNGDLNINGPLSAPVINGYFVMDEMSFKSVVLSNALGHLHWILQGSMPNFQVKGSMVIDGGQVNVRGTNLELAPSQFNFKGDFFDPVIDIHLSSKVEDMMFHLNINGTSMNPNLMITSDPPMAPQQALQVLFTDNAWSASTTPFNGITSTQLAQNFLNYSLADLNDEQFGMKTKLTDRLKLGVEMDQMPSQPGSTNVYYSRKINGEMDMSEHMSLNVSQEVMPQDSYAPASYQDTDPQAETQVYLQYKKRF